MKCKNCKMPFGLNLEEGFENESIGSCAICNADLCVGCLAYRIETPEVINPGAIYTCRECIISLTSKVQQVA
jgi:hypothetical protein